MTIDQLKLAPSALSQATEVERARAVAEVQAAVIVAQQFPRHLARAWSDMEASCNRLPLASRAFYAVPNRGTGASVHLARELARIWGNLDYGVRELRRDDIAGESEIQAYAWDQQANVRSTRSFVVPHAKMAGGGRKPLTDLTDIYLNNQNIGARAVRESIFSVLPADFAAQAKDLCRATVERGDGQSLDKRIAGMLDAFAPLGVTAGRIEARLGRHRSQFTPADVADMLIVFSSIRNRETSAEDEFPAERVTAAEITGQKPTADQGWPETRQPGGGAA